MRGKGCHPLWPGSVPRVSSRSLSVLVLLACAALILPASASAARTVSVTASSTLKVANDSARLGFGVSKDRRTRGAALRAVSAKLRAVIAAAQAIPGVGTGDVSTGRISFHRTFRGHKTIYRANASITVILHQPDKAGELVGVAVSAGATGVSGPTFFVGDSGAAEASALAGAFQKAKARAAVLAAQAGATLGPALEIDEGEGATFLPESSGKAEASPVSSCGTETVAAAPSKRAHASACAGAPAPTKPGNSTVTATVHVIFELL
jgi:uncharacterized protein